VFTYREEKPDSTMMLLGLTCCLLFSISGATKCPPAPPGHYWSNGLNRVSRFASGPKIARKIPGPPSTPPPAARKRKAAEAERKTAEEAERKRIVQIFRWRRKELYEEKKAAEFEKKEGRKMTVDDRVQQKRDELIKTLYDEEVVKNGPGFRMVQYEDRDSPSARCKRYREANLRSRGIY